MVTLLKFLVIVALLAVIGGGAYGTYYLLIQAPKERDAREIAEASNPQATATPDPSSPDFETAQTLKRERNYPEARTALEAFLIRYPDSSHHDQALGLLGDINLAELFSGHAGPNKVEYVVRPGEVLDRVAKQAKSDPELIYQANSLDRIMLRIGQKLLIPQVDFSVEVHLNNKRLVLLDHGKFFKSYALLDVRLLSKKTPEIRTKIQEKIATENGIRVVFGSRQYEHSLRSLTLAGQPGYTVYPISDALPGTAKPPGSGLGLEASDAEELHTMVSVGDPVTITSR